MKFKAFIFILAVQIFAANLAFAQEAMDANAEIRFENESEVAPLGSEVVSDVPADNPVIDICSTLPQLETEYLDIDRQSRSSDRASSQTYRSYVSSFNDMTQVLFELSQSKREEMQRIDEAEQSLRDSLATFNDKKDLKNSKELQDQYMNLTVRLYSSAMDGQKTVDQLKKALAQVENSRARYDTLKQEPIDLENKKLQLEGKIISLKIRCRR